ncbi:MAG: endo-1,4-beta-xylanase [Rhodothermaceae bacterium]|nr:endo-1,4-beta-xylanase [Rhodothermaceae bacterium]
MDAIVQRSLLIHISEMDVRVNPQGDLSELTTARSELQKQRVKDIVTAFMDLPEANRFAITWWGLRDPESWLIEFWGNPEWGLLFDAAYRPKPAYEGFLEALTGN